MKKSISQPAQPKDPCSPVDNEAVKWLDKSLKFEAEMGRSYAPEFVSMMAEMAYFVVAGWLTKNNAPAEVNQLLTWAYMFAQFAVKLKSGTIEDMDAVMLTQDLPDMTRLIVKLGGSFQVEM